MWNLGLQMALWISFFFTVVADGAQLDGQEDNRDSELRDRHSSELLQDEVLWAQKAKGRVLGSHVLGRSHGGVMPP